MILQIDKIYLALLFLEDAEHETILKIYLIKKIISMASFLICVIIICTLGGVVMLIIEVILVHFSSKSSILLV